jgi:uncharacterized protein
MAVPTARAATARPGQGTVNACSARAHRPVVLARPPRGRCPIGRAAAAAPLLLPARRPTVRAAAAPPRQALDRGRALKSPGKGAGGPRRGDEDDENDDDDDGGASLALFRWALYARPWDGVAWSGARLAGGMAAWAASFAAVGLLGVPLALKALGVSPTGGLAALAPGDKAAVLLANQVVETVTGVAIIRATLAPFAPLPPDVLRFDVTDRPLARRDGWLTWAIIGLLAAPLAIGGAAALCDALGYGAATAGGRGTADGVAGLLDMDSATFAALLVVTAVLAPILEETVFRGFLLPSLTRWVPTPVAVVLSALAFACAHLSARDFPQLFAFGLVLGACYTRSRNLATPMLMHGAWNGTVLVVLYYLATHGVKVQELVRAGV